MLHVVLVFQLPNVRRIFVHKPIDIENDVDPAEEESPIAEVLLQAFPLWGFVLAEDSSQRL